MGKASGFKYSSDRGAIEEALADLGGGNFLKLKEGKNVIRILPPFDDSGLWFYESYLHYGFKSGGKTVALPCTGDGCLVCKKLNELASEGAEGSKLARRYGTRTKFYANVLDRDNGNALRIWGFSKKVLQALKSYWMDVDDGCEFDDPINGRDIIVERSGKGLETRYEVRIRPKSTPAIEDGEEAPELFNIPEEVEKEFTKEEIKEIWAETFDGVEPSEKSSEDSDVEDDEEPVKASKKAVKEDDDDEEEETHKKKSSDDDDDEDEEEETPKNKKASDEDEEEEEKPKAKSKAITRREKRRGR